MRPLLPLPPSPLPLHKVLYGYSFMVTPLHNKRGCPDNTAPHMYTDAGRPKPHAAPAIALDTHMWPRDLAVFVASGLVLLGVLAAILAVALSGLSDEQRRRVSFPTSLARAQALGAVLSE